MKTTPKRLRDSWNESWNRTFKWGEKQENNGTLFALCTGHHNCARKNAMATQGTPGPGLEDFDPKHAVEKFVQAVIIIHFILTVWAAMPGFLSSTYIYMNLFVLMVGVLGIVFDENAEIVFMFFLLHIFTIIEDILLLGLYQPRAHKQYEQDNIEESARNEYRFALGMAIANLIIKPFTAFLLFRVSQERGGNYAAISFPGVSNLPGFGGRGGMYEDIDRSSPQHTNIETAEPHKTLEKPSNP